MRAAGLRLARDLTSVHIAVPQIPVVHNVHAQPESDPERIRELLVKQIHSPVRWVECVRRVAGTGVNMLVEVGPGKVLAGLCKRIEPAMESFATEDPSDLDAALAASAS
jgi:[acyl-carrier-protein] S-malonyltransferase